MKVTGLDRFILRLSPARGLDRIRARAAADVIAKRHFEAATPGRRTQNWRRPSGDANAANAPALTRLRNISRDLDRNNPWARHAKRIVSNHVVGWGIVPKPITPNARVKKRANELWNAWAYNPKACDWDGRLNFPAMQRAAVRTIAQDGEVLIRRRWLRMGDQDIPVQLQLLEADHLDMSRDLSPAPSGGVIVQGVEYDKRGKRVAYWLFEQHPGATARWTQRSFVSKRVPAEDILHVYRTDRIGQVRGVSWYAPIILRLKDFDEYEDATLMRQKIAACFSAFVTDVDGDGSPVGETDKEDPLIETLEPGMIQRLAPGENIVFGEPPQVSDHASFSKTSLRAVAAGFGVPYSALTGDFQNMPFSAARMERIEFRATISELQWDMLIPQFCDGAWSWAMEAAELAGRIVTLPGAEWTPPPPPMIEPDKEMIALQRAVRNGVKTFSEAIREMGYDPEEFLQEYADDLEMLDRFGIVLDTDARHRSQQGHPSDTGGDNGSADNGTTDEAKSDE
ncbi:phage portal protein [Kaustia mangrovi]|uniref:Phage portal protein n=1 Tax=Kaustia mangrovi TaxID=2593653 RepID=A0A7S8C6A8_9HYPH|nr:phage portal protein [Kaustia mangrovi]QPC43999.1 phage portal protein [Kaustia mangrovi]